MAPPSSLGFFRRKLPLAYETAVSTPLPSQRPEQPVMPPSPLRLLRKNSQSEETPASTPVIEELDDLDSNNGVDSSDSYDIMARPKSTGNVFDPWTPLHSIQCACKICWFNFKSLKWKKVLAQQEPKRVPWNAVKSSWTERPQLEQADWRGRTELPHVLLAVHRKLDGKRFNEWWPRMKDMLRGAGLLSYAILPPGKGRGASSSWSEKSALAAQWVLAYVSSDTYSIVPLDCRQDAYALLRLLRQFTGPFRFMDLPRELRDHIYKILLIKSTDPKEARCIAQCIDVIDTHPMNYFLRRRLFRPARRPSLIHVSHQVRTEALHIYYAKNAFCMQLGRHTVGGNNNAAAIIARWAKQVGIETLGELRDLTVNIKCFHEQVIDIRVTYSPEKGLSHQVDGHETRSSESHREHSRTIRQQCIKYEQKQKRTRMDEYLSVIEERRKRKGGDGRTVIDYFTADPDALRLAYWGPPGHFEEDSVTFVEDEADRLTWVMW